MIFLSCSKRADTIEIYLVKNRIQSSEGIPIEIAFRGNENAKEVLEQLKGKNVRYDTIAKEWVYSGRFKALKRDLEQTPLFTNNEILKFDKHASELTISKSAFEKLCKLDRHQQNGIGHQFAICINGEPALFGYLFNDAFNSYWSTTYQLLYINPNQKILARDSYSLYFGVGRKFRALDSINEKQLFLALKSSNRLK